MPLMTEGLKAGFKDQDFSQKLEKISTGR